MSVPSEYLQSDRYELALQLARERMQLWTGLLPVWGSMR